MMTKNLGQAAQAARRGRQIQCLSSLAGSRSSWQGREHRPKLPSPLDHESPEQMSLHSHSSQRVYNLLLLQTYLTPQSLLNQQNCNYAPQPLSYLRLTQT